MCRRAHRMITPSSFDRIGRINQSRGYGEKMDGLREAVLEMMRDVAEIGVQAAEVILREVPELRDASAEIQAAIRTVPGAELLASFDAMVRALPREAMTPSTEVVEATRLMARARIPLPAVLRCFRVVQPIIWQSWSEAVRRALPDSRQQSVHDAGAAFMFTWNDRSSEVIAQEYQLERDRLAHATSAARIDLVERLLAGAPSDPESTRRTLGYAIEGVHVAAVLWTDHGADVDSLLRLERAATRLSGEHRPLLVPAGAHTMWAWMHTLQTVGLEADVHAAIGDTGTGLIGFRDSHNQALQARRVAELIPGMPGRIIRFADVEVLSLCTVDPDRARAFARRVLGDLAGDGDIQARLRETLSTHFQTRFNQRETARRLGLHHNTVIYRLQQANAALGRPVDDDPVAVALALRLAQLLPVTQAQS